MQAIGRAAAGAYEIKLVATNRFLSVAMTGELSFRFGQRTVFAVDIEDAGNGYFYIRSADTGEVMTIQGRGESGDSVILARQNRADTGQFWLIKPGRTMGITSRLRRQGA